MSSATAGSPERQRAAGPRRVSARVEGTVQGVGFRPFVFRLASELGLAGFVLNDARGVLLEVEGDGTALERFFERLSGEAPPLATVERIERRDVRPSGEAGFEIVRSERSEERFALVSPDTATCGACLGELFDPADRRFRYPFVNCTNCGPRFTIVRGTPYDRPLTTMAGFEMCERCRAEYEDPTDRRFHAQPNACPACGPSVRLTSVEGTSLPIAPARDSIEAAATAILAGSIVATKGLGGFHLVCRADDQTAVSTLRGRKHREDKQFALMAPDLAGARKLVELSPADEALLVSRARPIVLARRVGGARVADAVAPRSPDLGLMLPYSPLHHLLLRDAGMPLVMTSGNVSDEPIAYRDDEALERLSRIADVFLLHDRPIETRTDDSVVRTVAMADRSRSQVIRRSRGYVPNSIDLPFAAQRDLLACGAELKSTFCLVKGSRAWVGHHIGDLQNYETLHSFEEGVRHFERLFAVEPRVVAHDLHPEYLSTKYALERDGVEHVGVQHHHAHLAACLAELGEEGPAVGAIYDGTGYGTDGTIWGGELLFGDLDGFERTGHLWPVRMPGGEQAIREPWRMACAWLVEALDDVDEVPEGLSAHVEPHRWHDVSELARSGLASPTTSSVGRLFDAVGALCGIRAAVNYEGQAAVELEAQAWLAPGEHGAYPMPVRDSSAGAGPLLVLDARETVRAVLEEVGKRVAPAIVSARFHNGLALASARACAIAAERAGTTTVVLSGGVFQNRLLLERCGDALRREGLRVLVPERLPPNDGGISYGQAAIAARRTN